MRMAIASVAWMLYVALAHASSAATLDWGAVAGEEEIIVTVQQEDGTPREVTIWLVVLDEQGYIRTRGTSWRSDLERNPNVSLRIAGNDYPVRVSRVENEMLTERINATFTDKYGVGPHIMLGIMRPFLGPFNIYRADGR